MRHQRTLALLVTLLLTMVSASWAQNTGSIVGQAVDPTGAVIPGVTVTLDSESLLQPLQAVTTETGRYRFTELPIGTYTVTFELSGFQTVVREDIILTAGRTITVNAEMALSAVQETVTVSGKSPVVDVRQTDIAVSFDRERLEEIPTARDPWVILEQSPGVVMDRQNVGGNESGQQSLFVNRGTDFGQNVWTYDGINITDPAASGATPMYYDFGAFDEINITSGGSDPSMQTAGIGINFVIKSGSNDLSGQGSFYGTDAAFQGENVSDQQKEEGAGAGAPIKYILDYGFDIGGPIVEDRAWIWGDYGVQDIHRGVVGFLVPGCDDPDNIDCLHDDPTLLRNANVKFNLQLSENNKFNFLWAFNDKTRDTRGASDTRSLETTWKQSGPVNIYKFEDTHIFSPEFLMTGRFAYVDGGFALDYQDPGLRNTQGTLELSTFAFGNSFLDYRTSRPQTIFNLDGNYFLSNALGGDHEFKFGFQYKKTPIDSFTTYGGDGWAIFADDVGVEAWLFRQSARFYDGKFAAFHFQDIYTKGNMTLKLGLRFDHQTGQNLAGGIPANQIAPDLLPAIDFGGTPPINAWDNLSPRVGFTYDLSGQGTSILRASYARYYDFLLLYDVVAINNAANVSEVDLEWTDLNGDRTIQRNELGSDILFSSNYDPANPSSVNSPNQVASDLSAPHTDELIVGFEQELAPELAFSVNFIYKSFGNLLQDDWFYASPSSSKNMRGNPLPFVDVPSSAFVPVTDTFEGQTVTYYELAEGFSKVGDELRNWKDYSTDYKGIELVTRKRLSNRWMANVAFTYGDSREHYNGPDAIYDPTNIDRRDGGQTFYQSGGSGRSGIFMNSRWNFKFDGLYQLPKGFTIAGKLNGRQGFVFPRTWRSPNRAGGLGRVEVILEDIGESRLDDLWVTDLRIEKSFEFGSARLSAMADVFNLFNANAVLGREKTQNISTASRIQDILSARIWRFGVRFNW